MNIKVLINTILIILLLHFLIKKFNFNKTFHLPFFYSNENFIQKCPTPQYPTRHYATEHKKTMEFLLDTPPPSTVSNKPSCYRELVNYVDTCSNGPYNKPGDVSAGQVKPGNYYVEDENSSNFMSNVLNVHKFYDINNISGSYDGLDNSQLTNLITKQTEKIEKKDTNFLDKVADQTCFPKRNLADNHKYPTNDNTQNVKPDNWNYINELPMNGGNVVGNVVGYDSLNTGYSNYFDKSQVVSSQCKNSVDCNKPADDIRFGLGYPNQEYRNIR